MPSTSSAVASDGSAPDTCGAGAVRLLNGQDPAAVSSAADHLAAGGLVAFPTETVYGLGARADCPDAVGRIYARKGRPATHPLIVHVADVDAARLWAAGWPPEAERLAAAFWPGPLTLVVPRRAGLGEQAAGGQDTIGLRVPAHPVAQALLRAAAARGVPGVAAPSANRFGRVSPTLASHVLDEFADPPNADDTVPIGATAQGSDLLVLDGGACEAGIESTLVDVSRGRAVLLRPGVIGVPALQAALGASVAERDAGAPRASGTLASHYAPDARVLVLPAANLAEAIRQAPAAGGDTGRRAVYSRSLSALQLADLRPGETVRTAASWNSPADDTEAEPATGAGNPRQRTAAAKTSSLAAGPAAPAADTDWILQAMPDHPAAAAHELFRVMRAWDLDGVVTAWVEAVPDRSDWDGVRDRLDRAASPR
jgi:L-threonylcarbamoyladenylate synthase